MALKEGQRNILPRNILPQVGQGELTAREEDRSDGDKKHGYP